MLDAVTLRDPRPRAHTISQIWTDSVNCTESVGSSSSENRLKGAKSAAMLFRGIRLRQDAQSFRAG